MQLLRSHGGSERKAYFFPTKERGGPSFDVADTGMFAARFPATRRRETDADRSPTSDEIGRRKTDAALEKKKLRKYTQHYVIFMCLVAPPPTPQMHKRTAGGGAGCGIGGWRCVSSALQPVWVGLDKVGMLRRRGWVVL